MKREQQGLLAADDNQDVFVHYSNIQKVEFERARTGPGQVGQPAMAAAAAHRREVFGGHHGDVAVK